CSHGSRAEECPAVSAEPLQLSDAIEQYLLHSALFFPPFCRLPVEFPSVYITGIRSLRRVRLIAVIVELPDLVAAVKHRDAGQSHHTGMEHQVAGQSLIQ